MLQLVSATTPDWTREACGRFEWNPGRQLLRSIRLYQRCASRRGLVAKLGRKWAVLTHRFWSAVGSMDIPINAQIGGGLLLPHANGVVIHPDVEIGPNCLLMHQTTLGSGGRVPGVPKLGGHVDVGCGAKILGGVRIGDHAKIGANAVVLCDVPAGATAVGIPARVILPQSQTPLDDSAILTTMGADDEAAPSASPSQPARPAA